MLDFRGLWDEATTYEVFVRESTKHCGLWEGVYRLAKIPAWARDAAAGAAGLKLLVLVEDWCGDASNTVPVVAKLADDAPGIELRVLRRDAYPAVMDAYLTGGSRSIPIVIALDREFVELGHWGPRPAELQAFVMKNKATMDKAELYPLVRRWYARDRGESTLREILALAAPAAA